MNLNFLKNFAAAGGETLVRNITTEFVKMAPDMASSAELRSMEDELDGVNQLITRLTHDLQTAQTEYERENGIHTQLLGAAEHMQAEIATLAAGISDPAIDPAKKVQATALKASKEASLGKLVTQLEQETRTLDTDKKEVDAAQQALEDANTAYAEKSRELVTAKEELSRARNDMERAEIERSRAAKRAETQRQLSGLSSSGTSNVRVATEALRATAQKSRDAAVEQDRKATTLKESREQTTDDPNIAAAMAAVAASSTTNTGSVTDRLAALRR